MIIAERKGLDARPARSCRNPVAAAAFAVLPRSCPMLTRPMAQPTTMVAPTSRPILGFPTLMNAEVHRIDAERLDDWQENRRADQRRGSQVRAAGLPPATIEYEEWLQRARDCDVDGTAADGRSTTPPSAVGNRQNYAEPCART